MRSNSFLSRQLSENQFPLQIVSYLTLKNDFKINLVKTIHKLVISYDLDCSSFFNMSLLGYFGRVVVAQ